MNTEIIAKTVQATLAGTLSFPDSVDSLTAVGVEYYHTDYVGMRKTFYSKDGDIAVVPFPYGGLPPVSLEFSVENLRSAIFDCQCNGQTYCDFARRAMEAGVQSYFAFLRGIRVTYLGRCGDQHTSLMPFSKSFFLYKPRSVGKSFSANTTVSDEAHQFKLHMY